MKLFRNVLLAAALALPGAAFASVSLDCQSNLCFADVVSPGSPTPFQINWSWSYAGPPQLPVIIPANCTNKTFCTFRCLPRNGVDQQDLQITVTANDANSQLIGTASATMQCGPVDG